MMLIYAAFFVVVGLIFGSFINVCIYRIPRDESLIHPRSHCPSCNALIHWYDNIPVISFILLGRKCRNCGHPISFQYPLVELLTGLAFLAVAVRYPLQPILPLYLYAAFALIVVSGIDLRCQIIPDVFSYSLLVFGILGCAFNPALGVGVVPRIVNSVAGIVAGGGILLLIGIVGEKILKKEAMGGGDVKLMAGIGAIIGWQKVLLTLFLASGIAAFVGLSLIAARRIDRKDYIPFGPFLAAAALACMLLPEQFAGALFSLYSFK